MLLRLFFVSCLLFGQWQLFSQKMYFENISRQMNLPSQECYTILQDGGGYIWFGTEQGLCRYNGENLLVYNEKNGLPEKAIYAMAKDSSGAIWVITSANRVLHFKNGSLSEALFSKRFQQLVHGRTVISFAFVNKNDLCVSMLARGTIMIDRRTGACTELKQPQQYYDYQVRFFGNSLIPFNGAAEERRNHKKVYISTLHIQQPGKPDRVIPVSHQGVNNRSFFLRTSSGKSKHCVAFQKNLIVIDTAGNYTIRQLPSSILSVYADRQGGLWVGTLLTGLFYFPKSDLKRALIHSLTDCSVSHVIQDDENNIWCTTLEKGLFFCKNQEVLSYPLDNLMQNPEILTFQDSTIYVGWQKKIVAIKDDTIQQLPFHAKESDYLTDLVFFDQAFYISSYSFIMKTDKDFKKVDYVRQKRFPYFVMASAKQFKTSHRRLYTLSNYIIGEINNNQLESYKVASKENLGRCFEPLDPGRFLVGLKEGAELLTWNNDSSFIRLIPGTEAPVSDMITDWEGRVLVATKGEGLFLYSGDSLHSVNAQFGISARVLFEIRQDVYGKYWISSSEGLFCCSRKEGRISTVVYTTLDGLPANEIHKLALSPERIFFSSIYGISSLPLMMEQEKTADPKIHLTALQLGKSSVRLPELPHNLTYDQNSFRFTFDAISFKNNQHRLVYYLTGRDSSYAQVNGTELVLENLRPGEYELIVYAENEWGVKSKQPFIYRFYISKPFWLTWWFIALTVAMVMLLFGFILQWSVRRAQARAEERNRVNSLLAESQLTAIQAQMNPHFVFNAINSIQNYILKNQKEEAYHYLAKFSHLIRMVLNHSKKKLIPLAKELEVLTLYVELEQLRFKQAFEFEVKIPAAIDEDGIVLPPMLVQPLLENAIWHGLMPLKDRKGKLCLLFSVEGKVLKIVIEDNGIGREHSFQAKMNVDHHSMALDLVKERIQMVKQLYQAMEDASIQIIDLFDERHQPAGTRVEIFLPIL
ncbi:MAG: histidine kinase [Bacteroidetes bacterium]|nr:histidine kinase [Bacteroidota bacterium]